MGTYLSTGIVQEIAVYKEQIKYPDTSIDNISLGLQEELNLDCYNYSQDEEGYYWKIKPEMLEGNLAEFMNKQFQMCKSKIDGNMQDVVDQLREASSGDEIIKLATSRTLINFQIDQLMDYVSVIRDNGFKEYVTIYYKLIAYFIDGKIITEGLGNSLRYFESNIRLQKDKYPIADCVKIMVTS
jgi:hypothetical protein